MTAAPLKGSRSLRSLGPVGAAALIAAGLALLLTALSVAAPMKAVFVPSPSPTAAADREKDLVEGYSRWIEASAAQFNGRSVYFVPSPPPPPPPPPAPPVEETAPPPPPPPATYGGPALIGMILDVAWFADGKKLGPGQSDGDLKVVRLQPPWEAGVVWKDVEFTISLFARDTVVAPPPKAAPAAGPAPDAPQTPAPTPSSPSDPPESTEGPP